LEIEHRSRTRLKTLVNVVIMALSRTGHVDARLSTTCLDLSAGGMLFASRTALRPGSVVLATISLPDGDIDASGHVIRCEPGQKAWRIAVKFKDVFEEDRRRLEAYISEQSNNRWG